MSNGVNTGVVISIPEQLQFQLQRPQWKYVQNLALISVAYFVAAEAAFFVGTLSDRMFAPFWPPNIVLFCALVFTPRKRWWAIFLAVLPAHMIAEFGVGMSASAMLVAFVTNCLFAVLNAEGLRKFAGAPPWFATLQGTACYLLVTGLLSPALVAFGGAFVPILDGGSIARYPTFWAQWYAANALGSLTLGPIALIAVSEGRSFLVPDAPLRQRIEAVLLGAALVSVCMIAFNVSAGDVTRGSIPTILYSPLPLLVWTSIRFGAKGASAAILIVAVVLTWLTLNGPSIFDSGNSEANVFAMQAFLIGLSGLLIVLGASIEQTRHAEIVTRESEGRMAFAAAAANVGMWLYDRNDGKFWMTDYCRAMFGIGKDQPVTRGAILKAVHPDDRELAIKALRATEEAGQPLKAEFRIVLPDGAVRWYLASAQADGTLNGEPLKISGIITDITERKDAEAEAALQRKEIAHLMRVAMLGELSGSIAHELTQPLTAILSNAQTAQQMLARNFGQPSDLAEILNDIIDDDNRASEVIRRLRNLFQKSDTTFDSFNINSLIGEVLRLLRSELINRKVEVIFTPTRDLPATFGDAVQIQQVLLNLVLNAVDAMHDIAPSQRKIRIRTSRTDLGSIAVSIEDGGSGIADGAQIFTPFFTTKGHGLGLGLSICQTIIKSHGGSIALRNNPAGGATAQFVLPGQVAMERAS